MSDATTNQATDENDTTNPVNRARWLADEKEKRWARFDAHVVRVEESRARIHGRSPHADWTFTPIEHDPHDGAPESRPGTAGY